MFSFLLFEALIEMFLQCEREYHVGCLKQHNMQDLAVPSILINITFEISFAFCNEYIYWWEIIYIPGTAWRELVLQRKLQSNSFSFD